MAHDGDCEKICEMIDELDGWTKIEALQSHENEEISKISVSITELFFREQVSLHFDTIWKRSIFTIHNSFK